MGADSQGEKAVRRKTSRKAECPGSASQTSRGRPEESQEQKTGLRTVTLTTKNTPHGGEIRWRYLHSEINSRPVKNAKNPMGAI